MSDTISNISQLMQEILEAQRTNVQRVDERVAASNAAAQQNQLANTRQEVTPPLVQEQDFFEAVREDQDFQDFLDDEQLQDDLLAQEQANSVYQDAIDQRRDDIRDGNNALDVRG